MVILLYEFTCINLHDKLFYPLRNSKKFNVRSIQFISDFVDRFNVAHCYNWHAIYTSHARLSLRHCYCVNGRLLSISGRKVRRSLPLNGPTDSGTCHRIIP